MVAPQQRIARAFFVFDGNLGDVSRYDQERGGYREAAGLQDLLTAKQ